jgi:hypothetical protein
VEQGQLRRHQRLEQARVVVLAPSDPVLDVPLVLDRLLALLCCRRDLLSRRKADLEPVLLIPTIALPISLPLLGSKLLGRALDGVNVARILRDDRSDVDRDVERAIGGAEAAGNESSLDPEKRKETWEGRTGGGNTRSARVGTRQSSQTCF